jgi:uncharacterized protein YyaL (SSP411 family)
MKNPSFSVTALTVSTLAIVAIFKVVTLPHLPPSQIDQLDTLPNNRTMPAPLIEVGWRSSLEEAAQEAKRRNLGLFVLCIDPTSLQARQWETGLFRESELVRVVRRHFIPVKLKIEDEKYLSSLILPLGRTQTYTLPGVNVTALLPDGKLLSHLELTAANPFIDFKLMREFLLSAKEEYEANTALLPKTSELHKKQEIELRRVIQSQSGSKFDATSFYTRLKLDKKNPAAGFKLGPFFEFRPGVLRIANQKFGKDHAQKLIDQTFQIGLFDPLDGGLFRRTMEDGKVDVSRDIMANAYAMQVLAEFTLQFRSRESLQWTREIFRFLQSNSADLRSIASDQTADDRSPRYSITLRKMEAILDPEEKEWLRTNLLKEDPRHQEFLRPTTAFNTNDPKWLAIRTKLLAKLPTIDRPKSPTSPEVEGYTAARMFQTARLFGDEAILKEAQTRSANVYGQVLSGAYLTDMPLTDLLGIVDCATEDFLATRNQVSLASAIKVFRVAMKVASVNGSNIPMVSGDPAFWQAAAPELCDPGRESLTTIYLRLTDTLAHLLPDRTEAESWLKRSSAIRKSLAPFLSQSGPQCASLVDQFTRKPLTIFVSDSIGKAMFREIQTAFPELRVIRPPLGTKSLAPVELRTETTSTKIANLAELKLAVEKTTLNRS